MGADKDAILQFVSDVGRRTCLDRLCRRTCRGLLVGSILAVLYLCGAYIAGVSRGPWSCAATVWPAAAAVISVLLSWRRRTTGYETAKRADDRLGLKDQLAGAYQFIRARQQGPLHRMVIDQTRATIAQPKLARKAAPFSVPRSFWLFMVFGMVAVIAHARLFPPVEATGFSEATQREIEQAKESLEDLLALEAEFATAEEEEEFARIRKLVEDLNLMSENATKDEILARLAREIAEFDAEAESSEAMSRTLEELRKLRERVVMGDLLEEAQAELDKGAEELAAEDQAGRKVTAEAIETLALVERQAQSEDRKKQSALAEELKQVAEKQEEPSAPRQWELDEEDREPEKARAGEKKQLAKAALTYADLRQAVETRDIRAIILTAAGDNTRSSDSYHEVYHNYRRILESVLYERSIPAGQEMYIRRYFKVIRPRKPGTGDRAPSGDADR